MSDNAQISLEALIAGVHTAVLRESRVTNANIDFAVGEINHLKDRVVALEQRTTSERVHSLISGHDLAHDAKLGLEIAERRKLDERLTALDKKQDTQLAILGNLQRLAGNPRVQQILSAVGTAILTWLAIRGGFR